MPLFLRGMAMTIFASVSFGFLAYLLLHYDDRIIENYFSTLLQFITTIQVEDQMLDRLMDYFNLYFNKETLCILLVVMHIAKGAILVCIMYYTLLIFKQR